MRRIFQISKELNISHFDIIAFLKYRDINVGSHMSPVDENVYGMIVDEWKKDKGIFERIRIDMENKTKEEKNDSEDNFENNRKERPREQSNRLVLDSEMEKTLELTKDYNWKIIKIQYRKLMKEYHPDKVSHLGKEIKDLSKKKTLEIREAYDYFKRKYFKSTV